MDYNNFYGWVLFHEAGYYRIAKASELVSAFLDLIYIPTNEEAVWKLNNRHAEFISASFNLLHILRILNRVQNDGVKTIAKAQVNIEVNGARVVCYELQETKSP